VSDSDDAGLPVRLAARVVVLDPDGAVLLMRYDHGPPNGRHWSTPGGGLEDSEDYRQAALREVREETGWDDLMLGEEILRRDLTMEYAGSLVRQHERLFLARVSVVRRALGDIAAMHRADQIAAWRWWTLAELEATDEVVWPAELPTLSRTTGVI
jgi:ADP-ribose pyrophosphatase YjhB (NUDIX family)